MDNRKLSEIYEEKYNQSYNKGNMNDARYWRGMMILEKEREKETYNPFDIDKSSE